MKPEPLIFPRGVRYATVDEIPGGSPPDSAARVAEAERIVVTTGYVRIDRPEKTDYSTVIEANVHAPKLWITFRALVEALLPAVAAPIVGVIDEPPVLGDYTTREAAIAVLALYADSLVNDGFLEFGCMFQHQGKTEEIFIPSSKFLRVWTNEPERAEAVLRKHGIPSHPSLRFIDEFPLVRQAEPFRGTRSGWFPVVEELSLAFRALPPPDSEAQEYYEH